MTELRDITPAALEAEVRRIASESPDFVYEGTCTYLEPDEDDKPVGSCIMGRALLNLGASPADLLEFEGQHIGQILNPTAPTYRLGASSWLFKVQIQQDRSVPWGKAVEWADRR